MARIIIQDDDTDFLIIESNDRYFLASVGSFVNTNLEIKKYKRLQKYDLPNRIGDYLAWVILSKN